MTLAPPTPRAPGSPSTAEVILYKDSAYTSQGAIPSLMHTIPALTRRQATELALQVNTQGQAVIWQGGWPEAELYRRRLSAKGLTLAPISIPAGISSLQLEHILSQTQAKLELTTVKSKQRLKLPRRFKFTSVGWKFTLITILVSVAAFNTGNNPLYLLFGLLLGLIIISGILSERVLQYLRVRRQFPQRIFAGQEILIPVTVKNLKQRLPSFSLQISERLRGVKPEERPSVYVLKLEPKDQIYTHYRYLFPRRGVWISEGFEISTSFPFELFRKGLEIDQPLEVIVYPRLAPPPPLPQFSSLPRGAQPRPHRGATGEFFALREFRETDDIRSIHWKSSAKRDQLVVKELERQDAETITLCFYNAWVPYGHRSEFQPADPQAHRQILEQGVELCAGLAEYLIALGHPIALVTLDARTEFGTGATHLDQILIYLARVKFHGDPEDPPLVSDPLRFDLQPMERCAVIAYGKGFPSTTPAQTVAKIPIERSLRSPESTIAVQE